VNRFFRLLTRQTKVAKTLPNQGNYRRLQMQTMSTRMKNFYIGIIFQFAREYFPIYLAAYCQPDMPVVCLNIINFSNGKAIYMTDSTLHLAFSRHG
jgi:hypothetical protein